MSDRIAHADLRGKAMTADKAAQFIDHGDALGVSGFIGAGCPRALPAALANRGKELHARGKEFVVDIYTGASTAPDCDGVMTEVDIIRYRMSYQRDPALRKSINSGKARYRDIHLSHSALYIKQGFLPIDTTIVEVTRITENGHPTPSSSAGSNVEWMDNAGRIIVKVNSWQPEEPEGMYDIHHIQHLPSHIPMLVNAPGDRTGIPYVDINLDKVVAVAEASVPGHNSPFKPLDETSKTIVGHFLDFLEGEARTGRLAYGQYIMQSSVGNVSNAVMADPSDSKFENIKAYTETIQDGMIDPTDVGKMTVASATSFSLSPEAAEHMDNETTHYRENIILRPQQTSNHPEIVRRVGLTVTNDMIETDIYGNVNSTHINGSCMMDGIGGSGSLAHNAFVSSFISPSLAKGGVILAIVPFASHIDYVEYNAMVIITERGFADLRGLAPRDRVVGMISVVHPEHRLLPEEHYGRALKTTPGVSAPHDLRAVFDFHVNMIEKGSMKS